MSPTYNAQMTDGEPYHKGIEKKRGIDVYRQFEGGLELKNETGKRFPRTVQYFTTAEREGKLHPTQKPVALFEYLIKTYTNEGDLVLDNCAGSFTTAIAAENTKRNWICMEQLEEYCEIGRKRIEENRKKLSTGMC